MIDYRKRQAIRLHLAPLLAICLALCLLWTQVADVVAAPITQTTATPISAADSAAPTAEPLDCINPLKAGHIAASIASLVPIPFFKDAADLAAYGLNLELKNCPPHLVPANNLAYQPPPGECSMVLRMPIAVNYNALTQLDAEIIAEVMDDPDLREIPGLKAELEKQLALEYGRFTHEIYGSYINIYGIQLPLNLSEFAANDWGTVGRPEIYHYNSDVLITLRHPGERLNTEYVRFFAGTAQGVCTVRIGNTILAGNSAGATGPDCTAQVRSDGHNLLSNLADCTVLGATATNIIDANVGLSALAAADGETYGHPLLETSRAVDAGSCALATDQRGMERPQGAGCDIGALEFGGILVSSTLYLPVVAR